MILKGGGTARRNRTHRQHCQDDARRIARLGAVAGGQQARRGCGQRHERESRRIAPAMWLRFLRMCVSTTAFANCKLVTYFSSPALGGASPPQRRSIASVMTAPSRDLQHQPQPQACSRCVQGHTVKTCAATTPKKSDLGGAAGTEYSGKNLSQFLPRNPDKSQKKV